MELNLKLSFDNMDFSTSCVDRYTVIIQKEGLDISGLEYLKKMLYEESYSIENIRLLGDGKVKIEGNIEDGVSVVNDIFDIVEAVSIEKDLLITKLKQCGFNNSDVKLVVSKL